MILVAGGQLSAPLSLMLAIPQGTELLVILLVVALLFGSKKLPDLARSSGRSLRIFKSETRGLLDDAESRDRDAAGSPVD